MPQPTSYRRSRRAGPLERSSAPVALAVSAAVTSMLGGVAYGKGNIQVERVAAGAARITQQGENTRITATNRTVIDYSRFNLAHDQSVQFALPGPRAAILNRIHSPTPSVLDGHIVSNGVVYFANPAGVIFGPDAIVNVAGLYAAAAHISNKDFAAGVNHFTDAHGAVVNNGSLQADVVNLVGQRVVNNGVIVGKTTVTMVSGNDVLMGGRFGGILVKVDSVASAKAAAQSNAPHPMPLGSGDIYSMAVINAGQVKGANVTLQSGGQASVSGAIDASNRSAGGVGGNVAITAPAVHLSSARIDASGSSGGGTVLVGGDAHGQGILPNANTTTVSADSSIHADAISSGNGGKVVVWSDQSTQFHGSIFARGGAAGGNGGFVETSGHALDTTGGFVDASAAHGAAGTWLLDPAFDLTIDALPSVGVTTGPNFQTTEDSAVLSATDVIAELNLGTNVNVQTTAGGTGTGAITVAAPLAKIAGPDASLTLNAVGGINVLAPISSTTGKLNVNLISAGDVTVSAAVTTNNGSFVSQGVKFTNVLGPIDAGTGSVTLTQTGKIGLGANVTAASFAAHTTDSLGFAAPAVSIKADTQSYQAGTGSGSSAAADLITNTPLFLGSTGPAPVNFTHHQDAAIADANIVLAAGQFTGGLPANYTIQSDGGGVHLTTAANVAGSKLTLAGKGIEIDSPLTLGSLSATSAAAPIQLPTGAITTAGAQTYGGAVTLSGDSTLTSTASGNITLGGAVTGPHALAVTTAGTTLFSGAVNVASLTTGALGATTLAAGAVTTTAGQLYGNPVTLASSNSLSGATLGYTTIAGAGNDLAVKFTSGVTIDGSKVTGLGQFTAGPSGLATTIVNSFSTAGGQTYLDPVTLGGAATLSSTGAGNISFAAAIDGAAPLSVNTAGTTTFGGAVGGGIPLASLATGSSGNTLLNGGAVTTSGLQTYGNPVQLGATTAMISSAAGNITFSAKLDGAQQLTVNTAGATTFGGPVGSGAPLGNLIIVGPAGTTSINGGVVTTAGGQGYGNPVTLGAGTVLTGSTLSYASIAGAGNDLTVAFTSGVNIDGTKITGIRNFVAGPAGSTTNLLNSFTTAGSQTYHDAVSLLGPATLQSTGGKDVIFDQAINGPFDLTVETTGNAGFGGAVNLAGTAGLTVVLGSAQVDGGSVQTAGAQSYAGNVTVGGTVPGNNVTFHSTGGAAIGFAGSLTDNPAETYNVTVDSTGLSTFGGPVKAGSLTLTGQAALNGGAVTTASSSTSTGDQSYGGAVLVGADTAFKSTGGGIAFGAAATLGGPFNVSTQSDVVTRFGAAVNVGSLTTNGAGPADVRGGTITTTALGASTGKQTYNSPVTLTNDATLTSTGGADILFSGTLDGPGALAANTAGATTFGGPVGSSTPLASLVTDLPGATRISGGGVITSGTQTYLDPVTLGADATLKGTALAAHQGIDGASGQFHNLTLVFSDPATPVGGVQPLTPINWVTNIGNLTLGRQPAIPGAGTTLSSSITTQGAQSYFDPLTLTRAATLASTGGKDVLFGQTVDGAFDLAVNTTGVSTFGGAVGGTARLASLATDAGGTTAINGGSIKTTAGQSYGDNVTLGNDAVLDSNTAGAITFAGTVDGGHALTVNTGGTTAFNQPVGASAALASLATANPLGSTEINGGQIITNGFQTYGNPLTLGANATLTSNSNGNVTFGGTVDGAAALTVNTGGTTTFTGSVGAGTALASLSTDAPGTTAINGGGVTTTGGQSYGDNVLLGGGPNAVLASTAAGNVTFARTLDGAVNLNVNTAGTTTFGGNVGSGTPLLTLATDAPGTVAINAGSITTALLQTYGDPATVGADAILASQSGGNVAFLGTVDGPGGLSINTAGMTRFAGPVGAVTPLASVVTDSAGTTRLDGGAVTTTGVQTYGDPLFLSASPTVLTSNGNQNVTFGQTVDGPVNLIVNTAGTTLLNGAAGSTTPLASITTNSGGATQINGGTVLTTGAQAYGDSVQLGNDATLTSTLGGAITFSTTLDGGHRLSINTAGPTTFAGPVGAGAALTSLATDAPGTAAINGGQVVTTDFQEYHDRVTLGANSTLASNAFGPIHFFQTVDGGHVVLINTGGTTTFDGAVGSIAPLTSVTTDAPGLTQLNGGSVTTNGSQTYLDPLTLGTNTVLASLGGGDIRFGQTVDGPVMLNVNTAGATVFGGAVGSTTPLISLTTDPAGSTQINGGTSITTLAQTYGDPVTLGADDTLTSTGAGAITFAGTVDGPHVLIVNTAGTTLFGGTVGLSSRLTRLTTDAPGLTQINGGTVNTTGDQSYQDAVLLGTNTILDSNAAGNVSFGSTLNGAVTLAVNTAGQTLFGGAVGGSVPLASLSTDSPGTTAINGGLIVTTGAQNYGDAATLGADAMLTSLAAGNVHFAGTLDGNAGLAVNTAGATIFDGAAGSSVPLASLITDAPGSTQINGGRIITSGFQTYGDPVTLGADATLTSNASGGITFAGTLDGAHALIVNTAGVTTFGGPVGSLSPLASVFTDAPGSTRINGGAVTSSGPQSYGDPVTLGIDTTLASLAGGDVSFASTVDGGVNLLVNTAGSTIFNGPAGSITPLASLATDAPGNTQINGGLVATAGYQKYGDPVTIGSDTLLRSSASGEISFAATLDGGHALAIDTAGATIFNGAVGSSAALASLTTDAPGSTQINGGSVTTLGFQSYGDPVVLGSNDVLTSTGAGDIRFTSTVDGAFTLTASTAGATVFNGAVGSTTPLASLVTDAAGATQINGGSITTTGAQAYGDPVTLGADTILASLAAGNVSFAGTLDGGFNLAADTAGQTIFNGAVGSIAPLASLATDSPGSTQINGGRIITSGNQTYGDPITLGADDTLTSNAGGNVTFAQTVDGGHALIANTAGTTLFGGAVGSAVPLTSLITDAAGNTQINGGRVTTTAFQTYSDPVRIGADTTLDSTAAGSIRFAQTLDGGFNLAVNTGGATIFDGAVGPSSPLASLTTDAPGSTHVNGGLVASTGPQTYGDPVILGADAAINASAAGNVTFAATVDGGFRLGVNTAGLTTFGGPVGSAAPLASLATNAPGATAINGGGIITTGDQAFGDAVTLGRDAHLISNDAGNVSFAKTVDGGFALAIDTAGQTLFGGAVGSAAPLANLTTDPAGRTRLNGGTITTTGFQTYGDPVLLGVNNTLTSTNAGNVTFGGTLDGAASLAINTAGTTTFTGPAGSAIPLASLATDAAGNTRINGGRITTAGPQDYADAATIGADTTLTSNAAGNVRFGKTLDGAFALAVNTAGTTLFGGAVGSSSALTRITTDAAGSTAINGGTVNTTGTQQYQDDVVLGAATTLTSTAAGDVAFGKTLSGPFDLAINTAGHTVLNGAANLAGLTTDGQANDQGTQINGGAVATSGGQNYRDDVTLGAATLLGAGGPVSFGRTLSGNSNLSISTPALATFTGTVDLGSAGSNGSLLVASGPSEIDGGSVKTFGAQTFDGDVSLNLHNGHNPVTFQSTGGGDIGFQKQLSGPDSDVSVLTAGKTFFGGQATVQTLTTDAPGSAQVDTGVAAGGNVFFGDAATVNNAAAIDSGTGSIQFNSSATLAGTNVALTTHDQPILLNGPALFSGAKVTLATNGGPITFGTPAAPSTSSFPGADSELNSMGGAVTFNGPITAAGSAGNGSLTINSQTGKIQFLSGVNDPGLALTAMAFVPDAPASASAPTLTFTGGDVVLDPPSSGGVAANVRNIVLVGTNIDVMGSVTAANQIILQPDPQLSEFGISRGKPDLRPFVAIRQPDGTFKQGAPDGMIFLQGDLTADTIELGPEARALHGQAPAVLTPTVATIVNVPPSVLGGTLQQITASAKNIRIAARQSPDEAFLMGPDEKFTALASAPPGARGVKPEPNLQITVARNPGADMSLLSAFSTGAPSYKFETDAATLGDLNAAYSLQVSAPRIVFWRRPSFVVLTDTQHHVKGTKHQTSDLAPDNGRDFFAGNSIEFNSGIFQAEVFPGSEPQVRGAKAQPSGFVTATSADASFGVFNGTISDTVQPSLIQRFRLHVNPTAKLDQAKFVFPGGTSTAATAEQAQTAVLDATPQGPSPTEDTSVLAQALPGNSPKPIEDESVSAAQKKVLRDMGIYARDLTEREKIDKALGRVLYLDILKDPGVLVAMRPPSPDEFTVAVAKLPQSVTQLVVSSYTRIYNMDANGNFVVPLARQQAKIKQEMAKAEAAYGRTLPRGVKADPLAFRAFLDSGQFEFLRQQLNRIRAVHERIQWLGLTSVQIGNCESLITQGILPLGRLTEAQARIAIFAHTPLRRDLLTLHTDPAPQYAVPARMAGGQVHVQPAGGTLNAAGE